MASDAPPTTKSAHHLGRWHFHLGAGALCLDFANTISWRRSPEPIERLATYADLISWARQAGLVSRQEEDRLRQEVKDHPRAATQLLRRARSLRESIFAVFAAVSENRSPEGSDLKHLQGMIQQAIAHSRLVEHHQSYQWQSIPAEPRAEWFLWEVVRSAGDLLTSSELRLVGQCSGRTCRWLWVDRTRNQSRRWCAMSVCGNRAKARRHYQRLGLGSRTPASRKGEYSNQE